MYYPFMKTEGYMPYVTTIIYTKFKLSFSIYDSIGSFRFSYLITTPFLSLYTLKPPTPSLRCDLLIQFFQKFIV